MLNVLLVDDAVIHSDRLAVSLREEGHCVFATPFFSEATAAVIKQRFDIILCEYWFGKLNGLAFFRGIKDLQETAIKVLMTGYPLCMSQSDLKKAGIDYLIQRSDALESLNVLKGALVSASGKRERRENTLNLELDPRGGVDDTGHEIAAADRR